MKATPELMRLLIGAGHALGTLDQLSKSDNLDAHDQDSASTSYEFLEQAIREFSAHLERENRRPVGQINPATGMIEPVGYVDEFEGNQPVRRTYICEHGFVCDRCPTCREQKDAQVADLPLPPHFPLDGPDPGRSGST